MPRHPSDISMRPTVPSPIPKPSIETGILAAFVIASMTLFAFIILAAKVTGGSTMAFDRRVIVALRDTTDPAILAGPQWLQRVMIDVSALGGGTVLTIITSIVVAYLLVVRRWSTAAFVAIAIAGGGAVNELLKSTFQRARPDLVAHLTESYSSSFPSAHAMNSALTYLTLAALLARTQKSKTVRVFLLSVALLLTFSVGLSRIYLGVHWPTDVIAGWCVGATWALIFALVAHALQRRDQIEQPGTSKNFEAPA